MDEKGKHAGMPNLVCKGYYAGVVKASVRDKRWNQMINEHEHYCKGTQNVKVSTVSQCVSFPPKGLEMNPTSPIMYW